jgi:ATP-dependent DNA helicase RecG
MELIEAGEDLNTEFKREYTDDIKKTITAFANTAGGTLYIGINDDKSIAGVENPDATLNQITNAVRSAIKPDVTLFVDYKTAKIGKKVVIIVNVQKGTACPYYLAGKGIRPEGVYVRQGASTVSATEAVILNMIKETDGEKYEEVRSLNQELTFNAAKKFFDTEKLPFGLNQQKSLCLQTTDGVYTNLGLLLSDQSIHTIKLAVFEGFEKEVFKDRREMSGSLLGQLNETYEYLDMYNHTHAEVKELTRQEKRDYPEDALREALLNALVHRDYAFSSSTLISIFDDSIEFVSIGGLPKGVSLEDILLGISMPRNENLANVFYRLRLIEAYGMGIPKIMRSYADYARKPEIQSTVNAFKIILPNRNINNHEIKDVVKTLPAPFNEKEEKIIALLNKRGKIVRKNVETALNVSQAMAVRLLRGLINKGVIRTVNGGKNTRYEKII